MHAAKKSGGMFHLDFGRVSRPKTLETKSIFTSEKKAVKPKSVTPEKEMHMLMNLYFGAQQQRDLGLTEMGRIKEKLISLVREHGEYITEKTIEAHTDKCKATVQMRTMASTLSDSAEALLEKKGLLERASTTPAPVLDPDKIRALYSEDLLTDADMRKIFVAHDAVPALTVSEVE